MKDKNERNLFKKVAKGDQKSQVLLYKHYYNYAMSISIRFSETQEEAKEVVQDSFLKLFKNFSMFEDKASFKAWFRKIIVHTAIDYYRKYTKHNHHLDIVDSEIGEIENSIVSSISANEILDLAKKLPPAYRLVFMLFIVEGYKHTDIAEKLDISVGASKSNLSKARKKMQKMIIDNDKKATKRHA